MNTEGHHLFLSVRGEGTDWRGGQQGENGGHCLVPRASEDSAPLLKVYLLKGSPTASPALVDGVNVLTLLTSPWTLSLIRTSKELQQQCRGGREEGRVGGVEGTGHARLHMANLSVVYPESCYS